MFNTKRIKELESRVDSLEQRVKELAHNVAEQVLEIDKLYSLFVNQVAANVQQPKPKPKYKPKKNGKENPKASE